MTFSLLALLTVISCIALVFIMSDGKSSAIPISVLAIFFWIGVSTIDSGIEKRAVARIQKNASLAQTKSIEKINTLLSMKRVPDIRQAQSAIEHLPSQTAAQVIVANHKPLTESELQSAVQTLIDTSKKEQLAFKKNYEERKENYEEMIREELLLKPGIALGLVSESLPEWSDIPDMASIPAKTPLVANH